MIQFPDSWLSSNFIYSSHVYPEDKVVMCFRNVEIQTGDLEIKETIYCCN